MERNKESERSLIADYYTKHFEELKAFVYSRLPIADEAEDIAQNIFLKLLESKKMITPITLPCFVYTMARNLIADYWRHRQQGEVYEHFIKTSNWRSRSTESVGSLFSAQEVNEMLERGIAQLSDKQSCVYRLNVYENMPVREIATTLNLSYKNTENRLGFARKRVRDFMKKALAS